MSMAAFFMATGYIYIPFLAPYLVNNGFSKELISYITSLGPLSLIIVLPVLGHLSDLIGRKRVINITLILHLLALILYLFTSNNYLILLAATIISAIAFEGFMETMLEKAEDGFKEHRGFLTGLFESFKKLGGLIGTAVGTFIVSVSSINSTIKIAAILTAILFVINNLKKSHNHYAPKPKDINFLSDLKNFWKIKDLRGMGIIGATMHFNNPAKYIFIPLLITQELNADIKYVGYFIGALTAAHLFEFGFGYACERFGMGRTTLKSVFIFSILITLVGIANSPFVVVFLGLLIGLASASWNTSAWCYMSEIGEKLKKEGQVVGNYTSIASTGGFAGFLVSGLFVSLFGIRMLFALYGIVVMAGIIISLPYLRKSQYY